MTRERDFMPDNHENVVPPSPEVMDADIDQVESETSLMHEPKMNLPEYSIADKAAAYLEKLVKGFDGGTY